MHHLPTLIIMYIEYKLNQQQLQVILSSFRGLVQESIRIEKQVHTENLIVFRYRVIDKNATLKYNLLGR